MNGSLMPFSSQYFPEAVFLDKIPPCSADTESGEPLHLAFNLYTFTNMKFFGYFVKISSHDVHEFKVLSIAAACES